MAKKAVYRNVQIVEKTIAYLETYKRHDPIASYSDKTFLRDIIFGIGLAFDKDKYGGPEGFELFCKLVKKELP